MHDETKVFIDTDQIRWVIHAELHEEPTDREPIISLSWGWTAGMAQSEIDSVADDSPKGHNTVLTSLSMAVKLRDRLNELIEEAKKFPPRSEPKSPFTDEEWKQIIESVKEMES